MSANKSKTLHIPLKGIYFDQIRSGEKRFEYRLTTDFWKARLMDRSYDLIILTRGYPAKDDLDRRLERPWRGVELQTITHPHFGGGPVEVYAIRVN